MTPSPTHPTRAQSRAAVLCDAGSCMAEPPRFVVIRPDEWNGRKLQEIAASIFTPATEGE